MVMEASLEAELLRAVPEKLRNGRERNKSERLGRVAVTDVATATFWFLQLARSALCEGCIMHTYEELEYAAAEPRTARKVAAVNFMVAILWRCWKVRLDMVDRILGCAAKIVRQWPW
jgi:tRNA G37 N-methylase Trm5